MGDARLLLTSLALMALRDLTERRRVFPCEVCGKIVTSSGYQTRYCSERCARTAQQRRYREKKRNEENANRGSGRRQKMNRRGQNEGSIYRRKDGRWAGAVSIGYRNGKRWRKTYYGKTRKEVQEKLAEALNAVQKGLPVAPERQTVGQYLEEWLEQSVRSTVRPRTFLRYQEQVRLHIKPALGHAKLAKLSPQLVQRLLNEKLEEGSRTSHRQIHTRRTAPGFGSGRTLGTGVSKRGGR